MHVVCADCINNVFASETLNLDPTSETVVFGIASLVSNPRSAAAVAEARPRDRTPDSVVGHYRRGPEVRLRHPARGRQRPRRNLCRIEPAAAGVHSEAPVPGMFCSLAMNSGFTWTSTSGIHSVRNRRLQSRFGRRYHYASDLCPISRRGIRKCVAVHAVVAAAGVTCGTVSLNAIRA